MKSRFHILMAAENAGARSIARRESLVDRAEQCSALRFAGRNVLFLLAVIAAFSGKLFAADVIADFTAANKSYAEGKFSDAAAAYQNILNSALPALNKSAGDCAPDFKIFW